MPDTEKNRKEYPLTDNQKPGTGFPLARIGALISLSCGAILNLGICRYAGKGQGEVSLLRTLWDTLRPGDVLLTDCLMVHFTNIAMLQQRGVELVGRLNKAVRSADFRRGTRLGKDDHLVRWYKPTSIRSLDRRSYHALPEFITVRETRVRVEQRGFRTKFLVVVTTLLKPEEASKDELATLYRARWNNELDLRSIKITMHMDILHCLTPEQVRKEIWTHVLAYNLIRTIMAQAASAHGIAPRTISFKGTLQVLEAFQPVIAEQAYHGVDDLERLYQPMLRAIAQHRVADRPDRFEPRMTKRRPKNYTRLARPRQEVKRAMAKQFSGV
jgi:Transposase DDE domain